TIRPANPDDSMRLVGRLSPEPQLDLGNGDEEGRLLEVLYCECCGTQLLCGSKTRIPNEVVGGGIPGVPGSATQSGAKFELTALPSDLEEAASNGREGRTDRQAYD